MPRSRGLTLYLPLRAAADSSGVARRAVIHFLVEHGAHDLVPDATLLTSELVSNSICHTGRPCGLSAILDGPRHLRIEVADLCTCVPTLSEAPVAGATGGRGLRIVHEVATTWGATRTWQGKQVWFELGSGREG